MNGSFYRGCGVSGVDGGGVEGWIMLCVILDWDCRGREGDVALME